MRVQGPGATCRLPRGATLKSGHVGGWVEEPPGSECRPGACARLRAGGGASRTELRLEDDTGGVVRGRWQRAPAAQRQFFFFDCKSGPLSQLGDRLTAYSAAAARARGLTRAATLCTLGFFPPHLVATIRAVPVQLEQKMQAVLLDACFSRD